NGAIAGADVFTVGAGAPGRINFQRIPPSAPFALDIGTVETLTVNGVGGADNFTVNSLAGVADLTTINLNGLDGEDIFNVQADANATINVTGGLPAVAPGDTLNVDLTGTTNPFLTATSGPTGLTGSYAFGNRMPVNFQQVETLSPV